MSLFGAFLVPSDELLFHETFRELPDVTVDIERVIATDEWLTPYFWMSGAAAGTFTEIAEEEPNIEQLQRLDTFEEGTLFRADWTEDNDAIVYAYAELGATMLEARGEDGQWEIRMRFDDRAQLTELRDYFTENGVEFALTELHEVNHPGTPGQYGLSAKQEEALVTAWEMDYYEMPRQVTLGDIADELDISRQALSDRLRRGYGALIDSTLRVA